MNDRLSLPPEVRARITVGPYTGFAVHLPLTSSLEEERFARDIEFRADGDSFGIAGYASTFDTPYNVAGGPDNGGWSEVVVRGAYDKALTERDDVRLLNNHSGFPLARTKSGTLVLRSDKIGLYSAADSLDLRNPAAQELRSALERGDVDEMSFAFRVTRQAWSKDYSERVIQEVRLFDVSVVTYPANPATAVQVVRNDDEILAPVQAPGMPLGLAKALRIA